jgi:hypothetical protein
MNYSITDYVYVVTANKEEKVKECIVLEDFNKAKEVFNCLKTIYGGANVCLCSRELNQY